MGVAFIGDTAARDMPRSWKRPTLEDAGRNSNYGFSPTTIFGIWPAKMCEMLSRVIIRNAASYSVIWSGRTTGTVMPALVAGIHV